MNDLDKTQGGEDGGPGETRNLRTGQLQSSPKYGRDDNCSSAVTSGGPLSSRDNTPDYAQESGLDAITCMVQELWENQGPLKRCFENFKAYHQQEYTLIEEALQEERYRCKRLEEELSDLKELYQNEILNLKEELDSMEDKIAYQSYESMTDIREVLDVCQTRLLKLEQHQQQVVHLEGWEHATAQTLLGKLINVLLAVMAALLVFVSTVANCVMKTCSHMFFMLLFVLLSFLWRYWDAISEYMHNFLCALCPEKGHS